MKQRILNYVLKYLFGAITVEEIISTDSKGVTSIDGLPIRPDELKAMQAEIKAMEGFRVWKIISETTKYHAESKLFITSKVVEDMNFGKAMLYNLSLQKSIMSVLKNKVL